MILSAIVAILASVSLGLCISAVVQDERDAYRWRRDLATDRRIRRRDAAVLQINGVKVRR